jgi:hypothetical protein
VVAICGEVTSQLDRVHFEHAIKRVEVFEQHPYAGKCAVSQARMSFITALLADVIQRIVVVALVQFQRLVLRPAFE